MYANSACTGIHKGLSFSVWGENSIILVQMLVIILMVWAFTPKVGMGEKLLVFAGLGGWIFFLLRDEGINDDMWKMISASSGGFIIASRVPQIFQNFSAGSTGQLAFVSFLLSFAGCVARLGTVLFETDDIYFQAQFFASTFLNGIIVLQFVLYWNSSAQKKVN